MNLSLDVEAAVFAQFDTFSREPTESANQQIQNNRQDGTIHTFSTTSRTESKIQNITDLQTMESHWRLPEFEREREV